MFKAVLRRLATALVSTIVLCGAALANQDGDRRDDHRPPSGRDGVPELRARTSPFDPPTVDTFFTDSGPGLDTGCTFNTDPNHPLIVDVLIDKFVGDVDGNGRLLDPAPLIAAGLIPSQVEVIMPAYDVDVFGSPPPERNEVFLNGEFLGALTGDDGIWKLNSFTVGIDKIRFPARPAPGAAPTPASNRIQVNVDTLSVGRWCTAIDWVALVIPIRPKFALRLSVLDGNQVRANSGSTTIDTIYQEVFDADCNVNTIIGPVEQYPFSGRMNAQVRLRAQISTCPVGSIDPPEVAVDWSVGGAGPSGSQSWNGFEGDVIVRMPGQIGQYAVDFDYTVNGAAAGSFNRRLFVTLQAPRSQVNPPRIAWYERATAWATGENNWSGTLPRLLGELYSFGGAQWRYGYQFGPQPKCNWQQLVDDPIVCDYSDCYVFSDVFENMAATLGIDAGRPIVVEGTRGLGFVTGGAPSLDPAFPGNARPLAGGAYDRYRFSSHSLRLRSGVYYDATFNGRYGTSDQFIAFNFNGLNGSDGGGYFLRTVEGARIYPRPGHVYSIWGNNEYALPGAPPPAPSPAMKTRSTGVQLPSGADYQPLDVNGDGVFEALLVDLEVDVLEAGTYTVIGTLTKDGELIANRPEFRSMEFTSAVLDAAPGVQAIRLRFSGEQIFRSMQDGPYDLELVAIGEDGFVAASLQTPPFEYQDFGELPVGIVGVYEEALDEDGDGRLEGIQADVDVHVRSTSQFTLSGVLSKDGETVADIGTSVTLAPGSHTVTLVFPALMIRRAGLDGPYDGLVTLIDAAGQTVGSFEFTTEPYSVLDFIAVIEAATGPIAQGVDSTGSGRFDLLRTDFSVTFGEAGSFLLSALLTSDTSSGTVVAETLIDVGRETRQFTLDFSGPDIHRQQMDGPYRVEISLRDPASFALIDQQVLPDQTAAFSFLDFDPDAGSPGIVLTGVSTDAGVDNDGNGLFDLLVVDVQFELANSGIYERSARLVDADGTEIGFHTERGFLSAGIVDVRFPFDGRNIGENGRNGPYFVKGLLIFGAGANLVATDVATTAPYLASQFEGYVPSNRPPIADAGADQIVECQSPSGTPVVLDGSGSSDPDGDPLTYVWTGSFGTASGVMPTVLLDLGIHDIDLTVSDPSGESDTDGVTIMVEDTLAPEISKVVANPNVLWPALWQMVNVRISVSAIDACSAQSSCRIIGVRSSEPPLLGIPDWQIIGDLRVLLRAKRTSVLDGRIYTITIECTDAYGNVSTDEVEVRVPGLLGH